MSSKYQQLLVLRPVGHLDHFRDEDDLYIYNKFVSGGLQPFFENY